MAKEVFNAREKEANVLNVIGNHTRGNVAKVNHALENLTSQFYEAEGSDYERMYSVYGDFESAELAEDGELQVHFVSKAYGDEGRTGGEIPIMSDEEYKKAAPREHYNPLRGEYSYSRPTLNYAANSVARFVKNKGGNVKRITYIEDRD